MASANLLQAQNPANIIERYIRVSGGKQKLSEVKKIEISKVGSTYAGEVEVIDIYEYPNKRVQHFYTNGEETYHYEFDGNSGLIINNGFSTPMSSEDIALSKATQLFMPELYYQQQGFSISFISSGYLDNVPGTSDKIQFTAPNGYYFANYYDKATGYKIRTEYMDASYEHFSDFEKIDGIVVPNEYYYQTQQGTSVFVLNDIAFNGLAEDSFAAAYDEDPYQSPDWDQPLKESERTTGKKVVGLQSNYTPETKKAEKPAEKKIEEKPIPANTVKTDTYQKKLALIIGNSAYQHGSALKNPVNDARAMSSTLKNLGFEVMYYDNVSQKEMKKAIDAFGQRLKTYEVGLFYYAGHGIQYKGRNYMIPVEANLQSEQQLEYDCIAADRVLAYMDYAESKVNIIVLDACRNNPFERSWSRSANGNGLAFMNAPSGSLIAYATSPGTTASDGTGSNGLYTASLLKHMNTPGLTIEQMFKRVRGEVEEKSNGKQTPWESTSLKGEFYFTPSN